MNTLADDNCHLKSLLMKDLLKFNTKENKLEEKYKDLNSKGIVYNALLNRENFFSKLDEH